MIRVEVNDTAVRALLARARAAVARPEPVLRAAGTTLLSLILGNFSAHGAGFRPAPWPPKKDGSPATLKKSGTLSSSFQLSVSATAATISNPMPYAALHQFGGRTAPHTIEPRRARALHWISGGGDHFARRVHHPGSNIPARPFIPITPSGDLTPAAATLIRAAAERAWRRETGLGASGP